MPIIPNVLATGFRGRSGQTIYRKCPGKRGTATRRTDRSNRTHRPKTSCHALKFCDAEYSKAPESVKNIWRTAATAPNISGYDLWMKESLRLATQGYCPPDLPSDSGGFTSQRAYPGVSRIPPEMCHVLPGQTVLGKAKIEHQQPFPSHGIVWCHLDLTDPATSAARTIHVKIDLIAKTDPPALLHVLDDYVSSQGDFGPYIVPGEIGIDYEYHVRLAIDRGNAETISYPHVNVETMTVTIEHLPFEEPFVAVPAPMPVVPANLEPLPKGLAIFGRIGWRIRGVDRNTFPWPVDIEVEHATISAPANSKQVGMIRMFGFHDTNSYKMRLNKTFLVPNDIRSHHLIHLVTRTYTRLKFDIIYRQVVLSMLIPPGQMYTFDSRNAIPFAHVAPWGPPTLPIIGPTR